MSNSAARLALSAALLASAVASPARATEPIAPASAEGESRIDPSSVGVPAFGAVFEGGSEARKLTGRAALRLGAFSLDATLSGADVNEGARSRLFSALDDSPAGRLTAGLTWTSFRVNDYEKVFDQLEKLCDEQAAELDKKAEAALHDDAEYQGALERQKLAEAAAQGAAAKVTSLEAALREAEERAEAANAAARAAWDGARAAALAVEKLAAAPPESAAGTKKKDEARQAPQISLRALDEARAKAAVAALEAEMASADAGRAETALARAEASLVEAQRASVPAEAAKKAADDALETERRRAMKPFEMSSCAASKLTPERQGRIDWPFDPTYIASLRGSLGSQSTDYLDPDTGQKASESVHPWKASVGFGTFLRPTVMLAAIASYGRTRVTGTTKLLCEPQPVTGRTQTPPVYACSDISVGVPTWSQTSSVRLEYRQHLFKGISYNPSFTYAWIGPEKPPFAPDQGAWQLEIPVYLQLGLDAEKGVVVGASYTHKQVWGGDAAGTGANDVSLFLGGALDIGKL